ncbi:MAG: TonB-dependent receptor plug domain-containing protein [Ignavibacteriales bacterium]|nr:TonB-dependent receptor plug domain-containing protein [Ignavibacteriales bacterium]
MNHTRLFFIVCLFLELPCAAFALMLSPSDSTKPQDSTITFAPLELGSLENDSSTIVITSQELPWMDYRSLGDILATLPGFFYNDLGSVGQPSRLTYRGMSANNIGVFIDGRPMNEPLTGIADLNFIPTEMIERIEIIPAPRSFLYGMNSNAVAINIVTKSFNSNLPYSRIKYTEGAYEEGLFDGIIAHNLSQNMNLSVGVQRRTTDGRYENSFDDEWGVRSKLRWNVSEKFQLQLSQLYNKQKVGWFGGIRSLDIYDPNFAVVEQLYSKYYNTQWSWQLNGVGNFLGDSIQTSSISFYASNLNFEYIDTPFNSHYNSIWSGVSVLQKLNIQDVVFTIGSDIEKKQSYRTRSWLRPFAVEKVYASLYGNIEAKPVKEISLNICAKFEDYSIINNFAYSGEVIYKPVSELEFNAYFSKSYYLSNLISFSSGNINPSNLSNHQFGAGVNLHLNQRLHISLLMHNFQMPEHHRRYWGNRFSVFVSHCSYSFDKFTLETSLNTISEYYYLGIVPPVFGSSSVFYNSLFFGDHLPMKLGIQGNYFSFNKIFETRSLIGSYNFLFFANLGDAVVHFTIENILNTKYYVVPFYPMPDRNLRLGVTWEFLN